MALYKRGNVYWAYVWIDGTRYAKSTGTSNRKLAEQVLQSFKEELNLKRMGMTQLAPEMLFGELAARFLAEGSPRPYHVDRLKVLLPFWEQVQIGRITKSQTREYREYRHQQRTLSDTTVNRDLECLRHILFWAVDEGYLSANPLSRVPMVRPRRKPRLILSVVEEDKLLAAAAPHMKNIIMAALDTGMRRGELLQQRWEHVDFDRRLISVTHSKTAGGEGREVPLSERTVAVLKQMHMSEGLVFTFEGEAIRAIKTAWHGAIRRAGIRYLRFHDLRHTFNSRLMLAGVQQEIRKSLMGHSDGSDVNSIYTHIELPEKREAIRKLELWAEQERHKAKEEPEQPPKEDERDDERLDPAGNPRESGEDRGRSLGDADRSQPIPPRRCRARRAWGARGDR